MSQNRLNSCKGSEAIAVVFFLLLSGVWAGMAQNLIQPDHFSESRSAHNMDQHSRDGFERCAVGETMTCECSLEIINNRYSYFYTSYPTDIRTCKLNTATGNPEWDSPPQTCAVDADNANGEGVAIKATQVSEELVTQHSRSISDDYMPVGQLHSMSSKFVNQGKMAVFGRVKRRRYEFEKKTFVNSIIVPLPSPSTRFRTYQMFARRDSLLNLSPLSANFSANHFDQFYSAQGRKLEGVDWDQVMVVNGMGVYTDHLYEEYEELAVNESFMVPHTVIATRVISPQTVEHEANGQEDDSVTCNRHASGHNVKIDLPGAGTTQSNTTNASAPLSNEPHATTIALSIFLAISVTLNIFICTYLFRTIPTKRLTKDCSCHPLNSGRGA